LITTLYWSWSHPAIQVYRHLPARPSYTDGYQPTETHRLQSGARLTQKVVPSWIVTDIKRPIGRKFRFPELSIFLYLLGNKELALLARDTGLEESSRQRLIVGCNNRLDRQVMDLARTIRRFSPIQHCLNVIILQRMRQLPVKGKVIHIFRCDLLRLTLRLFQWRIDSFIVRH